MNESRIGPAIMVTVIGIGALWIYTFLAARLGIGFAVPVGILGALSLGAAGILAGPVGRAVAQKMGLRNPGQPSEVSEQVLGELDDLRGRMSELEERIDFSERLLAGLPKNQGQEQSKF
jgi:hypothetical protein